MGNILVRYNQPIPGVQHFSNNTLYTWRKAVLLYAVFWAKRGEGGLHGAIRNERRCRVKASHPKVRDSFSTSPPSQK